MYAYFLEDIIIEKNLYKFNSFGCCRPIMANIKLANIKMAYIKLETITTRKNKLNLFFISLTGNFRKLLIVYKIISSRQILQNFILLRNEPRCVQYLENISWSFQEEPENSVNQFLQLRSESEKLQPTFFTLYSLHTN